MRKALITLAAAAALLAGSLAVAAANPLGIAGAQDEDAPAEPTHQERPRILEDALAGLVDDATITQGQADAVIERVKAAAQDHVAERGGPGQGRPGPGGQHGPRAADLESVADAIGIDVETLRQAMRDGQTLAEIAEANGVDTQTVIDALVAAASDKIDEGVACGRIDEAQAVEIKAGLAERITASVNGEGFREGGPGGPGRFGGHEGPGGQTPGEFGPGEPPADDE
jgi:hypothetical protein